MHRRPLRVVTFNAWMELEQLATRVALLVQGLQETKADICCLQEVFSPFAKAALCAGLARDHHILTADHASPNFPLLAYIPALLFLSLLYYVTAATGIVNVLWALAPGVIATPQAILLVLQTVMKLVCPQSVKGSVGKTEPIIEPKRSHCLHRWFRGFDFMATAIIARRDRWERVELVCCQPFSASLRGYPVPNWSSVGKILFYWLQMSFFRPGFLIARAGNAEETELLIVNVHLVLGLTNPVRALQIERVQRELAVAKDLFKCQRVVWCGDYNASPEQPEASTVMAQAGLCDTLAAFSSGRDQRSEPRESKPIGDSSAYFTWDTKRNPYVPKDEYGRARIDYIFFSKEHFRCAEHQLCFDSHPLLSDHFGVRARLDFVAQ